MAEKKKSTKLSAATYKNKSAALQAGLAQIKAAFGEESISLFSDRPHTDIAITPTGSIGLDIALGVGGYPRGRIIEVYGPEASGKTTLTLHAIAECQKAGGTAAFIDMEHAIDPVYAAALGVNMDTLLFSQPSNGEEALETAEILTRTGAVDLIVIDSVAALVPKEEIEGEMGSKPMGAQARLMSQACRKLTALANTTQTTIFFINQIRMKIGVMFGNPETTTGGNALKYYASVRLDIRRIGYLKNGEDQYGIRTRVKVLKNKVAPPAKEVEFDIHFGKGIQYHGELVDLGCDLGFVEKSGAWYSYKGERIGQGQANAATFMAANPDLLKSLEESVRAHFKLTGTASMTTEQSEE